MAEGPVDAGPMAPPPGGRLVQTSKVAAWQQQGGGVMTTRTVHEQDRRLTSEQVWRAIDRSSFAVLSYVTPAGEPRSSGVVYKTSGRSLVVAVEPGSWKARHVAADGRVSVTVLVRRGGILSLMAPIPPATISFHGAAVVHQAGSPAARGLLDELGSLVPVERWPTACVIEITPVGAFRTFGIGVSLRAMLDPSAAQARVPVTPGGDTQ